MRNRQSYPDDRRFWRHGSLRTRISHVYKAKAEGHGWRRRNSSIGLASFPGNNADAPGAGTDMDLNRLRALLAAPMACLFVILILCFLAVQRPVSTGIRIPAMRTRKEPLSFCEINGYTVYLRSDGKLAGGSRKDEIPRDVLLSRIREARDNIQDDTILSLRILMFLTAISSL